MNFLEAFLKVRVDRLDNTIQKTDCKLPVTINDMHMSTMLAEFERLHDSGRTSLREGINDIISILHDMVL